MRCLIFFMKIVYCVYVIKINIFLKIALKIYSYKILFIIIKCYLLYKILLCIFIRHDI